MRALAAAAVTAAALASASTAQAAFHWESSDPSCPSAAEVEESIARAAGDRRGSLAATSAQLDARASAVRVEDHYELHLETRDARGVVGERDLQGDTCAQVTEAAALVLALAQEPVAAPRNAAPSTRATPAAPPTLAPPTKVALRLAAGGSVGILPGAAVGLGAAAAVSRGRWRVEAQAEGWWPRTADAPRAGTGASVDLVAGGLRACFRPLDLVFEASVCTGPSVGDSFAHGVALRTDRSGGGVWGAWLVGLAGGQKLGSRLALRAMVEGGPRLVAPTFTVDSSGTLFQASAVEGRAWLGLEVELP